MIKDELGDVKAMTRIIIQSERSKIKTHGVNMILMIPSEEMNRTMKMASQAFWNGDGKFLARFSSLHWFPKSAEKNKKKWLECDGVRLSFSSY